MDNLKSFSLLASSLTVSTLATFRAHLSKSAASAAPVAWAVQFMDGAEQCIVSSCSSMGDARASQHNLMSCAYRTLLPTLCRTSKVISLPLWRTHKLMGLPQQQGLGLEPPAQVQVRAWQQAWQQRAWQ